MNLLLVYLNIEIKTRDTLKIVIHKKRLYGFYSKYWRFVIAQASSWTIFLNIYFHNVLFYSKCNTLFMWYSYLFFSIISYNKVDPRCWYKNLDFVLVFSFFQSCKRNKRYQIFYDLSYIYSPFFLLFVLDQVFAFLLLIAFQTANINLSKNQWKLSSNYDFYIYNFFDNLISIL